MRLLFFVAHPALQLGFLRELLNCVKHTMSQNVLRLRNMLEVMQCGLRESRCFLSKPTLWGCEVVHGQGCLTSLGGVKTGEYSLCIVINNDRNHQKQNN